MIHARLAPSAAHRWMVCPGSVAACEGLPNTDSEYAREGTFAHSLAADLLLTDRDAVEVIGTTDGEFTVDEAFARHIQDYLDVVRNLQLELDAQLLVEEQVRVSDDCWGTADAVLISPGRLDVIDLKFGRGVLVDVVDNVQLSTYALGAHYARPRLLTDVHLHVVQPRRPGPDGEVHREHMMTTQELGGFANRLIEATRATYREDAPLVAGEHCRFCPASATCPALNAHAQALAKSVFSPGAVQPPHPSELDAEQIAKVLRGAGVMEAWIKAVQDYALAQAHAGTRIPGFKLVETIGNRRWTDEGKAVVALTGAGIDPYAPRELLSPARAEKALGGRDGKHIVALLTVRPVTGVKLVSDADPRPELDSTRVFTLDPLRLVE